jgi:hypothetical protein
VSYVKKDKFCYKKGCMRAVLFVFFAQVTKNIGFSQNQMCPHKMLIRKPENVCSILFDISKYFFRWQANAAMCRIEFLI